MIKVVIENPSLTFTRFGEQHLIIIIADNLPHARQLFYEKTNGLPLEEVPEGRLIVEPITSGIYKPEVYLFSDLDPTVGYIASIPTHKIVFDKETGQFIQKNDPTYIIRDKRPRRVKPRVISSTDYAEGVIPKTTD